MKKTFFKNLFRDIKKSISRFLSIVIIIAVGVAFYVGVRATSPDMKISGDNYFDKTNFMDFKVISTFGVTENDLSEIKKQKGVTKAEGSCSLDIVTEKNENQLVLNVNSLPNKNGINDIKIVKGRKAQKEDEAVVEEKFLRVNKLKLNDTITVKSGDDRNIKDSLKETKFKIVGTAKSPLYISVQRQLSPVGNGTVRGFMYILPEVFKSEVYTEIYVKTDKVKSESSLLDNEDYASQTKGIEESLKDLGVLRSNIRYEEVLKEANDNIQEAEDKLESSKKEAEEEFAKVHKELNDGKEKLAKGREELKKNEVLFNHKMADGKKQIEDGKKQIQSGESEINSRKREIENGKVQIEQGKKQLNDSEVKLNTGKQQVATQIFSSIDSEINKAKQLMDSNPTNQTYIHQYNVLSQIYERNIKGKSFDGIYSSLKANGQLQNIQPYFDIEALKSNFDKSANEIRDGRLELITNEEKLKQGEIEINKGIAEIEASKKEISKGEVELEKGRKEGLSKFKSARLEIEDGQKQIDKNSKKLKDEEEKANTKIKDAEREIQKNKDKIKDIKKPEWYVLGRTQNVGYETYRQDSDRVDNIGKVFPLIFFLIAALVSLTTMTRMVQENRTEIGTFKALGYSTGSIVSHYLIYSLSASLVGSVVGILIGFRLFPPLIINAYGTLYTIPDTLTPFNLEFALQASLIAVLSTCIAVILATLDELKEVPASLMRPKPPKAGKKIFLERLTFIWNRLKFTRKVTARNIFRYKQRLLMTVIGIAACTGLMISGYGLKDGIIGATEAQFDEIYRFDMQGILSKDINEADKNSVKEKASKDKNVKSILFTNTKNGKVKVENSRNEDAYVIIPEDKSLINNYIKLCLGDQEFKLKDDGIVISEKLSRLAGKKIGDTVEINIDDKLVKAKVSGITEQYIKHYIYMSPDYYQKITNEKINYNTFYGLLNEKSEAEEDNTLNRLKSIDGINSIGFKNSSKIDYDESMESIDSVVMILIVSAGVLAFVVIYNLTNINITERRRELATIKLLGFYDHELASYIYRENMILTVIGSLIGIFFGIFLNKFVVSTAETNMIKFLEKISPIYFVYSVLLTILFSVIVNLAMYKRFDKIDMIESLKSAE